MVDNLIHSFGLQIENGIPILDFTDNKNDMELYGLVKLLVEASKAKDVPLFLSEKVSLMESLKHKEDEIMKHL